MSDLTDAELAELKRAADAAPKREWRAELDRFDPEDTEIQVSLDDGDHILAHSGFYNLFIAGTGIDSTTPGGWEAAKTCETMRVAQFFALANPSTVLRLVAELTEARKKEARQYKGDPALYEWIEDAEDVQTFFQQQQYEFSKHGDSSEAREFGTGMWFAWPRIWESIQGRSDVRF